MAQKVHEVTCTKLPGFNQLGTPALVFLYANDLSLAETRLVADSSQSARQGNSGGSTRTPY